MADPSPAEPNELPPTPTVEKDDPFKGKGVIIDPFTGERILSPERVRLIDQDLEEQRLKRERRDARTSRP